MTYEHGTWVVQESLACEMPDPEVVKAYDEIRAAKDKENTLRVQAMLSQMKQDVTAKQFKPKCVACGSGQVYPVKAGLKCRICGYIDQNKHVCVPPQPIKQEG
jgi:hypothetical protein